MGFENSVGVALGGSMCGTLVGEHFMMYKLPNKCAAHGSPPRPRPHCSQSPPFHPGPLIFPHATCMQPCPKQVAPLLYIIKCSPTSVPHMDPPKATPTLFSKPTVPPRPFDFSACYMHATLPQTSCTFVVHHKVLPNKCAAHGSPPRPRPHCSQSPPFHPGPLIFPHATCMQPCPKQVAPLLYIIKSKVQLVWGKVACM